MFRDLPARSCEQYYTLPMLANKLKKRKGRPRTPDDEVKEKVTIRLKRKVLQKWRNSGDGYQTRIAELLEEAANQLP